MKTVTWDHARENPRDTRIYTQRIPIRGIRLQGKRGSPARVQVFIGRKWITVIEDAFPHPTGIDFEITAGAIRQRARMAGVRVKA